MQAILRTFLYPAPAYPVPEAPAGLEEVWLEGADGESAHGWLDVRQGVDEATPAVVVLHGNGENLGTMAAVGLFRELRELGNGGLRCLALDYPGYGRSRGKPSEAGNIAAAVAALDLLAERFPQAPRALWGWSLGAAVGIQAAVQRAELLDRLVLLSAWTTLDEVARKHLPGFLVKPLLTETYDSVAAARELDLPALVIHGAEDRLIPVEHGERLSQILPRLHRFLAVAGAGHNDLLNYGEVWQAMGAFLARS